MLLHTSGTTSRPKLVPLTQGYADIEPDELRSFVRGRLAAFKVPRPLLILDEIPTGATGKPQRLMLARLLGLEDG